MSSTEPAMYSQLDQTDREEEKKRSLNSWSVGIEPATLLDPKRISWDDDEPAKSRFPWKKIVLVCLADGFSILAEFLFMIIFYADEGDNSQKHVQDYNFKSSVFDLTIMSLIRTMLFVMSLLPRYQESLWFAIILPLISCGLLGFSVLKLMLGCCRRSSANWVVLIHFVAISGIELVITLYPWLSQQFVSNNRGLRRAALRERLLHEAEDDVQLERDAEEAAAKAEAKRPVVARIISMWNQSTPDVLMAMFFLLLAAVCGLLVPKYTGIIVARALALQDITSQLWWLFAFVVMSGIATQLRVNTFSTLSENFDNRLRRCVHQAILSQDIDFFDRNKVGEFSSTLTSDVEIVKDAVSLNINVALRSLVSLIGAAVFLVLLDWRLTLVSFSTLPVFSAISYFYGKSDKAQSRKVQDTRSAANAIAVESFHGVRAVRASGAEEFRHHLFRDQINQSRDLAIQKGWMFGWYTNLSQLVSQAGTLIVLYYGYELIRRGELETDAYTQFIFYNSFLINNLANISMIYSGLMRALAAAERIFTVIDRRPAIKIADRGYYTPAQSFQGHVSFQHVWFAYPLHSERTVLRDVCFELPPGKVFAVVGPSGSGKSTLVHLIERFYDIAQGSVLLDGHSIQQVDPTWYHHGIGLVSQEPAIFGTSVAANIAFGMKEDGYDDHEVELAAKLAHAHEFITLLPDGYNTVLGEKGIQLSGGQKQRLAIARALMRKPRCLVFDEATSALDTHSEREVQRAIDSICAAKDRSVLIIAHRLSTITHADCILVMKDGRIVERGTNDELLQNPSGLYRSLYMSQQLAGRHPTLTTATPAVATPVATATPAATSTAAVAATTTTSGGDASLLALSPMEDDGKKNRPTTLNSPSDRYQPPSLDNLPRPVTSGVSDPIYPASPAGVGSVDVAIPIPTVNATGYLRARARDPLEEEYPRVRDEEEEGPIDEEAAADLRVGRLHDA